jgi:superfamily II DNA/RNA helicase
MIDLITFSLFKNDIRIEIIMNNEHNNVKIIINIFREEHKIKNIIIKVDIIVFFDKFAIIDFNIKNITHIKVNIGFCNNKIIADDIHNRFKFNNIRIIEIAGNKIIVRKRIIKNFIIRDISVNVDIYVIIII